VLASHEKEQGYDEVCVWALASHENEQGYIYISSVEESVISQH